MMCIDIPSDNICSLYWDKDKVCSDDNLCECNFLVEQD